MKSSYGESLANIVAVSIEFTIATHPLGLKLAVNEGTSKTGAAKTPSEHDLMHQSADLQELFRLCVVVGLAVLRDVVLVRLHGLRNCLSRHPGGVTEGKITSYAAAPPMTSWLSLALCSSLEGSQFWNCMTHGEQGVRTRSLVDQDGRRTWSYAPCSSDPWSNQPMMISV